MLQLARGLISMPRTGGAGPAGPRDAALALAFAIPQAWFSTI
jgi:hypothetical protein